jgi:phosphoserine phosphatase/dolichol kinase
VSQATERVPRLVVFDVEGIVVPARRFLVFEVAKALSLWTMLRVAWAGFLYNIGFVSIKTALGIIYRALRGVEVNELLRIYRNLALSQGTAELFSRLKNSGYRTALIGSGLPSFVVKDLASRLGAEYAVGCEVGVEDGRLTGSVGGEVIESLGKATVLSEVLRETGVNPRECVAVVNDRNNVPMMEICGRRIGFNPDLLTNLRSDFVVNSHVLLDVFPYVVEDYGALRGRRSKLRGNDLFRAMIHISGFLVSPICLYLLDARTVLSAIAAVTLVYTLSEYMRETGRALPVFSQVTRMAAVGTEVYGVAIDPILYSLGILLSLSLFPSPIGYACVSVLTLGDGFATVSGKLIGRTTIPFNKPKKLEGTLVGLLFAGLGASLFVGPFAAVLAATVGMLVECSPLPVNDNLSIPLAVGILLMTMAGS